MDDRNDLFSGGGRPQSPVSDYGGDFAELEYLMGPNDVTDVPVKKQRGKRTSSSTEDVEDVSDEEGA
jgi:hypothetical protein